MPGVIAIYQSRDGVRPGPPSRNDRFIPVIDLIRKQGLLDRPVLTPVCRDFDQADQVRRSILSSAFYYCSCGERLCTRKYKNVPHEANPNPEGGCPAGGQRISVRSDVVKDAEGKLRVQAKFFDKRDGIRTVIAKYGPDPSKWPYQARAKKLRK